MFLSRIALDTRRKKTKGALSSLQVMHGAIETCLGYSGQRKLWRVDWLGGVCYLLLLSEGKPDLLPIVEQFGFAPENHLANAGSLWESRNYDPLLERISAGQVWQFRLRANPTRSSPEEKSPSGRGKVFAHVTAAQQKDWLLKRASHCGFAVETDSFEVIRSDWERFRKGNAGGRTVVLRTATYEGTLAVVDKDLFAKAMTEGIGRAKAYGCGLLTVARP